MQAKLPVLAVTDLNTDIGKIIVDGGFGWWCESGDEGEFCKLANSVLWADLEKYSGRSYSFLKDENDVKDAYNTILLK